ncbi:spermidine synthase-like [Biomphalaria glabrata]|uniref:Spermidine synthase n=1 Tax=Biomphalaria glabrata TaxID=6526 RepID=A0A9W2YQG1_BIOGL|nr:spermidine synthase-like [Biomphalaria glabrata]XP_055864980.1 spermidine synthase-like [Biomphalaria glabrata]XP_055864981.1 spermidine synthase-like [Biomphalaria glabrata]XP_055864982.1 spermidine synthase-like [Biomphalaria glabrata]XP_055864983.1 spermidine synthase-like [Biomphalaria glabrata]XP_055864984.1 spermidine synthase-like [Biomphalaria glabrata]KAI8737538.1 spermidine synthase [Biomphalaria glabrata]
MNAIKDGWFSEVNELWPGQSMSLEVDKVLYHEKSKYQDILVFKSKTFGNVLVLDGVIQCTEKDEFSYQEMLAHLPLCSHKNPKKVLIIGGGDGGVAREVLKHECVEEVHMCEIDQYVVEVSKKYLPGMSTSFSNPRLHLHIMDGFEFMGQHQEEFDVIITDSSDPIGLASSLFEKNYYELMKKALKPNGIVCSQGECMWIHIDLIKNMLDFCDTLYPSVAYAYTSIPTYPCGQIGFVLCSLDPEIDFENPSRKFSSEELTLLEMRYYNTDMHRSSFQLPEFAKRALKCKTTKGKNGI